MMAHAQKPDFVFQRYGRIHLNRQGSQFSRLLAVEECGSAGGPWIDHVPRYSARVVATLSSRLFPLHFPFHASPRAITFRTYVYFVRSETLKIGDRGGTNRKVAGSIPDGVIGIFHWRNPPDRTMALGSTQPLTEWVPGEFRGGKCGRCVWLTTLPPFCTVVMKSGNLNFLEPSGPLQACNGTDLPLPLPLREIRLVVFRPEFPAGASEFFRPQCLDWLWEPPGLPCSRYPG